MENRNFKVLFITHADGMGGANHSMLQLMVELRDVYGVEVVLLAPKPRKSIKWTVQEECKRLKIKCISCSYGWFKGTGYKFIIKYILNIIYYPIILYKLRNIHFDIVHSNGSVIDIGAVISRIRHIKHVWHLREFGGLDFSLNSFGGKYYEKFVYTGGDCFIAISQKIKDYFSSVIPCEKIHTIYNGIKIPPGQCNSLHTNAKIQFCVVGNIAEGKNQIEALKAIKILVHKFNCHNFHLTFIGYEFHEYKSVLLKHIEQFGLNEYVTFKGECKNVSEMLKTMDVGLMLSKNEAFGRVTVEYMMHGLAVIASNAGANEEIISNNEDGLIYHLGDSEELAICMKRLIDDQSFMIELSEKGRQKALNRFTSDKNTKAVYDLYLSLLKTARCS